jgi:hypothetical protein
VATLQGTTIPENINVVSTVTQSVCYNATNTITVAGLPNLFVVESGGEAVMIAGAKIIYLPGTRVLPGGYMHGYITPDGNYCGLKSATTGMVPGDEQEESSVNDKANFKIYPNPTTGNLTIEVAESGDDDQIRAQVLGIHGETFLRVDFHGLNRYNLSLRDFPSGLYFIRLTRGDKTDTVKVIRL